MTPLSYFDSAALSLYSYAYCTAENLPVSKKEKDEDTEEDLMDEEKDNDLIEDEEEIIDVDEDKSNPKQQSKFWQTSNYGFVNPGA